jgi:hypothetical protein
MSIDPTTPINPGQGRLPEIHLAPAAVQRVTPDQQRNSRDDQQQAEEDAEEVFEELLEEAEAEDELLGAAPTPTAPGEVVAAAVPITPHDRRPDYDLVDSWQESVGEERRARDDAEDDSPGPHIDISA